MSPTHYLHRLDLGAQPVQGVERPGQPVPADRRQQHCPPEHGGPTVVKQELEQPDLRSGIGFARSDAIAGRSAERRSAPRCVPEPAVAQPRRGPGWHRRHHRRDHVRGRQPEQRQRVRGGGRTGTEEAGSRPALRYDYYNVPSSNTWNPKIGVKWSPIQELALRGTAGTGFRAPFITEAGNAGATFNFNSIRDTANCPVSNANGTPNLTSPLNVPTQCVLTPPYLQTSNKNVPAEKSDNFTAGFILEPVRGWSTTFDYYYIKLKGQIISSVQQPDFHATPENTVRGDQQIVTFGDGRTGFLRPASSPT